jgi:hypothetical protein
VPDIGSRSLVLAAALAIPAFCYTPPVETAGPLTVRILEPSIGSYGAGGMMELRRRGMAMPIEVALENSGEAEVKGTLRLGVIDGWRAEPASAGFSVAPRGRGRLRFTVTTSADSFNAHYPIHAFAEFEQEGRRVVAHPILIMEAKFPDPPRAHLPLEWKPVAAPAAGVMGLCRLPLHRESAAVSTIDIPVGRSGREVFEQSAPVAFGPRAITMRLGPRAPALTERVDSALAEYPIALPKTSPIKLRFGTGAAGTFRVRVLPFDAPSSQPPEVVFQRTGGGDAEVDLSRFAGREIRLQLECAGESETAWSEPALITGTPPQPALFPPPANAASRVLGNAGDYEVRIWPGRRGILDAAVAFSGGQARLMFHGFRVRALEDWLEDWRATTELIEVREEPAAGRYRARHRFRSWAGSFDVLGELWTERGALRARFWLENAPPPRPWLAVYLEEVKAGEWSERASRIYAGPGNVIQDPQAFQLGFDGHNMATSFVGLDFANGVSLVQAVDSPPDRLEVDPGARCYTLSAPHSQTLTFIPAASVWDGVKVWRGMDGRQASAGVARLAGRFVFDLWGSGGSYAAGAKALARSFRYGLTDAVVVWHSWQRWGYDYRLPDIYPPDPRGGTLADFQELARVCRVNGVLFAPHDNYIDYYPDSEGFSYDNIVFNRDGSPRRAWFNRGREAQSYRARGDRIRPFLERNLRLIKDGFDPTAYFIDVWSSMGPYDYWTKDGEFHDRISTRKSWGECFAWIRDFLGGNAPQISEAGHDQLIGWLDGAQANHLRVQAPPASGFVWAIRAGDAERIPWIDAAYHDRFVLHGAGYPDRYAAGLDSAAHGIYSDDYIATEVLTGRPAMVSQPFGRDVVRKYWLLHDLMRALALRNMEAFSFDGGNLHRQRVRWEGGAEISVNRGEDDWDGLPGYGFRARVPAKEGVVEAAIERQGSAVVEWARSPSAIYVNGRGEAAAIGPVTTQGAVRLTREGEALMVTPLPESRKFTVRLNTVHSRSGCASPAARKRSTRTGRCCAVQAFRATVRNWCWNASRVCSHTG